MALFEESGHIRFVSNVTDICCSGSIHSEVPVYPRCPKDDFEKYLPDCDTPEGVSQPSAREVSPGEFCRSVKTFTVSFRTIGAPPLRIACANVATSNAVEKSPACAA